MAYEFLRSLGGLVPAGWNNPNEEHTSTDTSATALNLFSGQVATPGARCILRTPTGAEIYIQAKDFKYFSSLGPLLQRSISEATSHSIDIPINLKDATVLRVCFVKSRLGPQRVIGWCRIKEENLKDENNKEKKAKKPQFGPAESEDMSFPKNELDFLCADITTIELMETVDACLYLGMKEMADQCAQRAARQLEGKSADEMRKMLGREKHLRLTEEQEQKVREIELMFFPDSKPPVRESDVHTARAVTPPPVAPAAAPAATA